MSEVSVVENQKSERKRIVGIIGILGAYGSWLKEKFIGFGCDVIGSDIKDKTLPSNQKIVEKAEVVVFSCDISETVKAIEALVSYSREDQLWVDITSIKAEPIKAMLKSKADVIGLHPMCGPNLPSWKGQTVVVCLEKVDNQHWEEFIKRFLEYTQGNFHIAAPSEHDEYMAFVQAMPHALALVMASIFTLPELSSINIVETLRYATPPYKLAFSNATRLLSGNPTLYKDIQISNKSQTLKVIKALRGQFQKLEKFIENEDGDSIIKMLAEAKKAFGSSSVDKGNAHFLMLARLMADLSEGNSIVIHSKEDRTGLLDTILQILKNHGINMTSLHSFKTPDYPGYSFHIGLEVHRRSFQVGQALKDIRNDNTLRDIIIIEDVAAW